MYGPSSRVGPRWTALTSLLDPHKRVSALVTDRWDGPYRNPKTVLKVSKCTRSLGVKALIFASGPSARAATDSQGT
jgi:hypothetical protein